MNLDCLGFPIGETGLVIASPSWTAAGLKQCEWRAVGAACDVGKLFAVRRGSCVGH